MKRRSSRLAFGLLCLAALFALAADATAQCNAAWAANTFYSVGAKVSDGARNYTCQQAHTSQVGWEPPNVAALWIDNGACSGGTATPTPTNPPTATPTGATATPTTPQSAT